MYILFIFYIKTKSIVGYCPVFIHARYREHTLLIDRDILDTHVSEMIDGMFVKDGVFKQDYRAILIENGLSGAHARPARIH